MLVVAAPGSEEEGGGEPLVGTPARLLDRMLASIGLDRAGDVLIADLLNGQPPDHRHPLPIDVAQYEPYLARQVELASPRLIVALGQFAAQLLLQTDASLVSMRGRVHRYRSGGLDVPVVVTFHPADLLRNPADKSRAWADLCLARATVGGDPQA
jgi:uracil-DNA glycosylase